MGLASALSTALTGLTAAETTIDVVGNNLANSQTVGFKASDAVFANQFLQTTGLGSAPNSNTGGTNPRQVGLGTQVAEIATDFTQGTIEVSSNPSDLAIQGDGFFIVQGPQGERFYTRNGMFSTNGENQLVTSTGHRLLGFGVDDAFTIQQTELTSLTIPLGAAAVAQPTRNIFLEGTLTPTGNVADTAGVIQSAVLGDTAFPVPNVTGVQVAIAAQPRTIGPPATAAASANQAGAALVAGTQYEYRFTFVDNSGTESTPNLAAENILGTVGVGDNALQLTDLPTVPGGPSFQYAAVNVYRRTVGAAAGTPEADFREIGSVAAGTTTFTDDGSAVVATADTLDTSTITGNYTYMITYYVAGGEETRPVELPGGSINVVDGRVQLRNLPTPPTPGAGDTFPSYDKIRIYRNLQDNADAFYLVGEVDPGETFTDNVADSVISDVPAPGAPDNGHKALDFEGPRIDFNTVLTNVVRRDGSQYERLFDVGTLTFGARKGGRALADQTFEIGATTTVGDLVRFITSSTGIQSTIDDPQHPISGSVNNITGETAGLNPGVQIENGQIRFISNNGVDNAVTIGLSAFTIEKADGTVLNPNLGFGSIQDAKGQSAVSDFVVYDSLGIPMNVRLTAVLESRTGTATTYRWFADSPDNDPLTGTDISVGTGLITFDGEGNFVSSTNSTVSIQRRNVPSESPLEFNLDFTQISGLDAPKSTLAASRQDGAPAGKLTSYIIGEDGVIRGVFSNGQTRDLGQVRLARFANPKGLEKLGQNLYAQGVNSGLPVEGNPSSEGIGSVVAGAVELSNTDIGRNLIDLVLATTQYRGNTRVITAAQQMLDELLNLRR